MLMIVGCFVGDWDKLSLECTWCGYVYLEPVRSIIVWLKRPFQPKRGSFGFRVYSYMTMYIYIYCNWRSLEFGYIQQGYCWIELVFLIAAWEISNLAVAFGATHTLHGKETRYIYILDKTGCRIVWSTAVISYISQTVTSIVSTLPRRYLRILPCNPSPTCIFFGMIFSHCKAKRWNL